MNSPLAKWAVAASIIAIAVAANPTRAGLIGFYDFEQNLNDTGTAPPLNMATVGSLTYSTDTPISGNGFAFGGTSLEFWAPNAYGFVSPGSNLKLELQRFTVEAWVNLSQIGSDYGVFSYQPRGGNNDGRGYYLQISPQGKVQFVIGSADGFFDTLASTSTLTTGTWHHIAGSYDGGFSRVFVDGIQEDSTTLGTVVYADKAGHGPNPKSSYVGIFHNANNTSPTFGPDLIWQYPRNGLIDRVRIHDVAFAGISDDGSIAPQLDYFAAVPEPSSLVSAALGLLGPAGYAGWRRRRTAR